MIEITQDLLKEFLDYNKDSGNFTWKIRDRKWFDYDSIFKSWNSRYANKEAGSIQTAKSGTKYLIIVIFGKSRKAHRLAWIYENGNTPFKHLDHINGEGTDNRIINLREVTKGQNSRNMKMDKRNTSGCTGVYWNSHRGKWISRITVNGKHKSLGYFDILDEAIKTRKSAEKTHGYHENHGRKR